MASRHAPAGRFHQKQRRDVVVFDSETVDLADLFSGEYWLHGWMISIAIGFRRMHAD